jgi:hypothetical protein
MKQSLKSVHTIVLQWEVLVEALYNTPRRNCHHLYTEKRNSFHSRIRIS